LSEVVERTTMALARIPSPQGDHVVRLTRPGMWTKVSEVGRVILVDLVERPAWR